MKRRDLLIAAGALVASVLPLVALAAKPCPPPMLSVAGGTSANTTCVATGGKSYTTNFLATENPISENGAWTSGKAVGIDWTDPQTVPGIAFPTMPDGPVPPYNDSIAHLSGFAANHKATATVHARPLGGEHEVELLLRFQITPHNARGYEIDILADGRIAVARWNGPINDYTVIDSPFTPSGFSIADGAVWEAQIVGSVITVRCNSTVVYTRDVQQWAASQSNKAYWADGNPGIGFWYHVASDAHSNFGWSSFSATDL